MNASASVDGAARAPTAGRSPWLSRGPEAWVPAPGQHAFPTHVSPAHGRRPSGGRNTSVGLGLSHAVSHAPPSSGAGTGVEGGTGLPVHGAAPTRSATIPSTHSAPTAPRAAGQTLRARRGDWGPCRPRGGCGGIGDRADHAAGLQGALAMHRDDAVTVVGGRGSPGRIRTADARGARNGEHP